MEQLVYAAAIPYIATIILFIFGGAFLGVIILMFVFDDEDKKIIITLLAVGIILLAYCITALPYAVTLL